MIAKGRLPRNSLVIPCGLFLHGLFLSAAWSFSASASALSALPSIPASCSSSSGISSAFFCFFTSCSSSDETVVSLRFFDFFSFFAFFSFFDFFFLSAVSSTAASSTDDFLLRSDFDSLSTPSDVKDTRSSFSNCFTAALNDFLDALSSSLRTDDRSFFRSIDLPSSEECKASMMEDTRDVEEVMFGCNALII